MTIVPLPFNKRMIYKEGRTLQILSLAGIASECPSIHSSEKITRLRISHGGFRYNQRDRAVSVKAASRQSPDLRFRRDANNQTYDGGSDGPILKGNSSILTRPHTNIELLSCRIARLRRVRVPDDPPSAAGGH